MLPPSGSWEPSEEEIDAVASDLADVLRAVRDYLAATDTTLIRILARRALITAHGHDEPDEKEQKPTPRTAAEPTEAATSSLRSTLPATSQPSLSQPLTAPRPSATFQPPTTFQQSTTVQQPATHHQLGSLPPAGVSGSSRWVHDLPWGWPEHDHEFEPIDVCPSTQKPGEWFARCATCGKLGMIENRSGTDRSTEKRPGNSPRVAQPLSPGSFR